jgi:hypothetical protein
LIILNIVILNCSNSPANGTYDFTFSLFSVPLGGYPMGPQVLTDGVAVTNGLFIVTLDFGSSLWSGQTNWLMIQVETNGASSYTILFPRQQLTPTPYAIYSEMASNLTGTLPVSQLSGTLPMAQLPSAVVTNTENGVTLGGTFGGNGGGLTNLNALYLAGGVVPTNVLPNFQAPNFNTLGGGFRNGSMYLYDTIGGGDFNTAYGGAATVGGGEFNTASNVFSFVGGGYHNLAYGEGVVAGGYQNVAWPGAFVGGGGYDGINSIGNLATGIASAVVGGVNNQATNYYSAVGGGWGNLAGGSGAFVGGGGYDGTSFSGNLASGNAAAVGGGLGNQAVNPYATVAGGEYNIAGNDFSTVAGGGYNEANNTDSTVGGGYQNVAAGEEATIAGGIENYASGNGAFIGGGGFDGVNVSGNQATAGAAVVAGGIGNQAAFIYAAVGGGFVNTAGGQASTVAGGSYNWAHGNYSFAAGQQAHAMNQGTFVWADSQTPGFTSTADDQFLIRAQGGVGIGTGAPAAALNVASSGGIGFPQLQLNQQANDYSRLRFGAGNYSIWDIAVQNTMNFFAGGYGNILVLQTNGNAIVTGTVTAHGVLLSSDRNAKENFAPLNPLAVLAKVTALPVTEWNYKTDDKAQKHIGPMAQDFQAAFHLSDDDKHISVVDEGGVALAAIQGLNQKLDEKNAKIKNLENRLNQLEQTLQSLINPTSATG